VIGEKDVADTEKPDIELDALFWCALTPGHWNATHCVEVPALLLLVQVLLYRINFKFAGHCAVVRFETGGRPMGHWRFQWLSMVVDTVQDSSLE
jgi:hypothetical protein